MNFLEAVRAMNNGKKCCRPDSVIHLYFEGGELLKGHNKNGDLLGYSISPEDFLSDDWQLFEEKVKEIQSGNLNLGEAINLSKQGNRITRSSWNNEEIYISYVPQDGARSPYLSIKIVGGYVCAWSPNHQDLLAEDWKIVDQ